MQEPSPNCLLRFVIAGLLLSLLVPALAVWAAEGRDATISACVIDDFRPKEISAVDNP